MFATLRRFFGRQGWKERRLCRANYSFICTLFAEGYVLSHICLRPQQKTNYELCELESMNAILVFIFKLPI